MSRSAKVLCVERAVYSALSCCSTLVDSLQSNQPTALPPPHSLLKHNGSAKKLHPQWAVSRRRWLAEPNGCLPYADFAICNTGSRSFTKSKCLNTNERQTNTKNIAKTTLREQSQTTPKYRAHNENPHQIHTERTLMHQKPRYHKVKQSIDSHFAKAKSVVTGEWTKPIWLLPTEKRCKNVPKSSGSNFRHIFVRVFISKI